MTPERWQLIKAILEQAEAISLPDRGALLDRLCAGDAELRHEVEAFLADEAGEELIHGIIGKQAASVRESEPPAGAAHPQRFGRYEIVRRIGQGGMGAVYEAFRVDDFHKKVALKVIHQSMDTDHARDRFMQERQLLARLEHPFIARLLDGGQTEEGSPYLVLEYVDGVPITTYCEGLDRDARLRLFIKVCGAVGHAHANLIVHRDLKPGNILVTPSGDPKLLDFGIAKLIDPGAAATRTGFVALTPDYASPEQVRGEPISTASDIYSLGIVLYQLLTGRKPYSLESATAIELDRTVCIEPVPSPALGDELDHILLMALRKEPERRYTGAAKFAEDIERCLDHRPVLARPDTAGYRARKFGRRYWWQIAAVVSLIVVLSAALAFSLAAQRRADRRFQQVRQLANRFLFDFHDEIANTQGTVKARSMIVSTALQYLNSLAADAGDDPGLRWELAVAYGKVAAAEGSTNGPSLGRIKDAETSYEKAVAFARPLVDANLLNGTQREALVRMLIDAADLREFNRESDPALLLAREAESRSRGLSPSVRQGALNSLTMILSRRGDLAESLAVLQQSVEAVREIGKSRPSWDNRFRLSASLLALGVARHRLMHTDGARAALSESLEIARALSAERPESESASRMVSRLLRDLGDLVGACDRPGLGQFEEAADFYLAALNPVGAIAARDANDATARLETGLTHNKIACSLSEVKPALALTHAALAARLFDGAVPASSQFRPYARIAAANAHRSLRHFAAAEALLKEASALAPSPDPNLQSDLSQAWARLEFARGNAEGMAHWYPVAIEAGEKLFRKTATPFYAWNLTRALEWAAQALPAAAPEYRARIVAVWDEQNRRFPGQPYIEKQLGDARARLDGR